MGAMAVRMEVSVVSATAGSAGRSIVRRETNSATRCCESAADPPLPATISLLPCVIASEVTCAARTTASARASSFMAAVRVEIDFWSWLLSNCFIEVTSER